MDAVLKGMSFQLKLDNYPDFVFAFCRILSGFGAAGLLLAAFLNKEVIQYPHEISLDHYLIENCSAILLIYNIDFTSLPLARLNQRQMMIRNLNIRLSSSRYQIKRYWVSLPRNSTNTRMS